MSIMQRQILTGILFSLIVFLALVVTFFIAYPLSDWTGLWDRRLWNLPFAIFVPVLSILIGLLFGLVSGYFWQRQLRFVEDSLSELEQGKQSEFDREAKLEEFDSLFSQIEKIKKHLAEQTKVSQKMANEKAEVLEKRIQEIVSEERNRLARELHDSVSQQLFAASMLMSTITESRPLSDDRETKQLKLVEEMIQQSQLEMRALLLHLRPVALKGKSLQEGIQELLIELQQKVPMNIQWKVEKMALDKGIEDHLFRILQESVSNTLRHAKATSLDVLLIKRDQFVIMRISDDGIGFNVEQTKTGSYGLQNMHERAAEIGGTLKIISVVNKGTRLEVKVPMIKEEDND
ncbi:sensor histidine kinase [Fictibacillus sp. Mic-4]|uniref:sensor histidine kinase n=1 Tax=Fictibacillus TaxID=1329200 RepID=UPI0004024E1D|nr:sensor histidine kinase [Fictibacillus gelatini]